MSDQFEMFGPTTSRASPPATSSPGLAGGPTPSASPDGPTTGPSGPAHVPANPSPLPGNGRASTTTATSGPSGGALSPSDALQSSLVSKLRPLLNGSPEREVTWKPWASPWGQFLSRPRASARRTSGTDIGLWRTPNTREKGGGEYSDPAKALARMESGHQINLQDQVMVDTANWPTPNANEPGGELRLKDDRETRDPTMPGSYHLQLGRLVGATTWPPLAMVAGSLGRTVWSTPRASDGEKGGPNMTFGAGGTPLPAQAFGTAQSGSPEQTESKGALNPAFVCWLMGYPQEYLSCAPSAMRSSRRLVPRS